METETSAKSPFQKLNFDNSSQKVRKSRYLSFLTLSNITEFLHIVPNILLGISVLKKHEKTFFILFEWFNNNYMKVNSDMSHLLMSENFFKKIIFSHLQLLNGINWTLDIEKSRASPILRKIF